jgi:hypothetical protein
LLLCRRPPVADEQDSGPSRRKFADACEGRNFIETVWRRRYVLREPHTEEVRIPA